MPSVCNLFLIPTTVCVDSGVVFASYSNGSGRMERRCWVNFQCWGVLLVWMIVGQGPIVLAVGAGGGCLDIFSLVYLFSFLSLPGRPTI